ncbi:MAG: 50S ribosomal protein L16 [Candidatus Omnitrophota bacterium]
MMPKRVKFRKYQRGRRRGLSTRGSEVSFGEFGLKATENAWMKNIQIEAARVAIMRHLRGTGKVWIRIFPDKSATKKPAETRMGKGKGAPDHWVAVVRRGKVLFEIEGVPMQAAKEAFRRAAHKLPFKCVLAVRPGAKVGE